MKGNGAAKRSSAYEKVTCYQNLFCNEQLNKNGGETAAGIRNSQIRLSYLRIKGRRGHKIAIVATARKLLGIIWHLLITGEEYIDKHQIKKRISKSRKERLKEGGRDTPTQTGRIHHYSAKPIINRGKRDFGIFIQRREAR